MSAQWQTLQAATDALPPKLWNLKRAADAGLDVPATWWWRPRPGAPLPQGPPAALEGCAVIVRSGAWAEDTEATSNAGQMHSEQVAPGGDWEGALARVIASLPGEGSRAGGVVFVQPVLRGPRAGVAFFDGFYYERSDVAEANAAITAGEARGDVARGHLQRGDAWSAWLTSVGAVFLEGRGGWSAMDVEFVQRDDGGWVLLQARPALFALMRNPTLSLANHREILGDLPSPWIVSVLIEAGAEVLDFFAQIDPEVGRWGEAYAVEVGGRAWMNVAFFFRLMDRWGLPRSFVTEGVGGTPGGPEDRRPDLARMVRFAPKLLRLQWANLQTVRRIDAAFERLDLQLSRTTTLREAYAVNARAMAFAIRTNFAINGILTGVLTLRRWLRVGGHARIVTQEMMEAYDAIAAWPDPHDREAALDRWLAQYGHRGPLESDPMQPRFGELREALLADVLARPTQVAKPSEPTALRPWQRPWYWIDDRREAFRDALMLRWRALRQRILAAGEALVESGHLDAPDDVFWLRGADLDQPPEALRGCVQTRREEHDALLGVRLPLTADKLTLEARVRDARDGAQDDAGDGDGRFVGIGLTAALAEGPVLRARTLAEALERITPGVILIVEALEPSWALVFPRVAGVVAEIGGELSHASILLREAKVPAVVNCAGVFAQVRDGDRVRLDGARGLVERITDAPEERASAALRSP